MLASLAPRPGLPRARAALLRREWSATSSPLGSLSSRLNTLNTYVEMLIEGTTSELASAMAASKNSALGPSAKYSIQPEESTAFLCGPSKLPVRLALDCRAYAA